MERCVVALKDKKTLGKNVFGGFTVEKMDICRLSIE